MKVAERRKAIVNILLSAKEPVSGGELAQKFDISRQIIVQDITVLKGTGYEILSTNQGYVMQKSPLAERVFKVRHTTEQTEDELSCIVALGGTVVDVFVWHKVYGKIEAALNIFSPMHIRQFLEGVRTGQSTELMHITGGYHYHTVRADSEAVLDRIEAALTERNYIVPEL
ncbi:MAG: transcription repressor NadR [Lachnospiraceae bacterium]|nr:transcription repressor NadR [Lachnospiraceae bacterium]MBP3610680.1 transcription repressor NadR [Lachnospiraceae bacterium]